MAQAAPPAPPPPLPLPAVQVTSPRLAAPGVKQVGAQVTTPRPGDPQADVPSAFRPSLEPPGPEILFRLDSEAALQERMRQEAKQAGQDRILFPDEPILSTSAYYGRAWPQQTLWVPPHYVCHRRLLFEEKNAERYGWEFGIFQPLVSTGYFFKDVVLLPMHLGTQPCRFYDCSAGKCLPGDPVQYLCYPPEWSLTGAAYQAAAIGTLLVMFP